MYMSLGKPLTLIRAEGIRVAQAANAKMRSKKIVPEHGDQNMYMSIDKPIALNSAESTRALEVPT